MNDIDKVITALEACYVKHNCDGCPYDKQELLNCVAQMNKDALDCLKDLKHRLESIVPIEDNQSIVLRRISCPNCKMELEFRFIAKLPHEPAPFEPRISEPNPVTKRRTAWCGYCGLGINIGTTKKTRENFCRHCGHPVLWP